MTTVSYAKLINLGNYENERIELEDQIGPDETVDQAYQRVRQWVIDQGTERKRQLRRGEVLTDIETRINNAESRLSSVSRKHTHAVAKYEQLRDLLAKHGVDIPELDKYWDLPSEQPQPIKQADDDQADDQADDDQADDDQADDDQADEEFDEGHP